MRRHAFFIIAAAIFAAMFSSAVFTSCEKEPDAQTGHSLAVTPSELEFTLDEGKAMLEVRTDAGSWTLAVSEGAEDWCVPERTSGKTSTSFYVSVTENAGEARSAVLTFTAPDCSPVEVAVRQEGIGLEVSPDEWDGVKRGNITYQALIYSFADGDGDGVGDLTGLKNRLDYLDGLGVSAIWLSPIHPSSSYHGYDVIDYSAVNPDFGTETDLQSFIDAAHERDIKVYLDYVLNHTSKDCEWFIDAKKSEASEYRDYYIFSKNPQQDIIDGRIAQIATEGAAGYVSGQWFPTGEETGASGRMKFVLDWGDGTSPVITVTQTDEPADEPDDDISAGGKYLYYGEEQLSRFQDEDGDNVYELVLDFDSSWGFLVRTSATSWNAGEKYGAINNQTIISYGEPFDLHPSTASFDPANVQFSIPTMYHSHFSTDWFADLNYGPASSAETSDAFIAMTEIADKWVEMGVDGFRLDAVKHIYHNQATDENPTFLQKFYDRMNQTYKAAGGEGDFYMVGEMLDEAANVAPYYKGLPALFEFSFWYRLKWAIQNGIGCYFLNDILSYQALYQSVRPDYIEATKLSNHDEDRTGSDLGQDQDKMKLAAAVLLTSGGEPYVYQGEELGYWGTKSNGDEFVRAPIMWDRDGSGLADGSLSDKVDIAMLTSAISVEAQSERASSVLTTYRNFARLRNTYPALAEGQMTRHPVYNETCPQQPIAAWYMVSGSDRMLVVHNFGAEEQTLAFDDDLSHPVGLQGDASVDAAGSASASSGAVLTIAGYSSVVFKL